MKVSWNHSVKKPRFFKGFSWVEGVCVRLWGPRAIAFVAGAGWGLRGARNGPVTGGERWVAKPRGDPVIPWEG